MLRVTIGSIVSLAASLFAEDKPTDKYDDPLKPFVENFKGRGALNDGSHPAPPAEALKKLKLADGLAMQVVAHEPAVAQPLNMYFDERGRLWVTQYLQYPFPAGLKIVEYDKYLRAVYDKVPPPPPNQIVHVTLDGSYSVSELYDAVWVTGRMRAEHSSRALSYVDGQADVAVGYTLSAKAVEPYKN